MIDTPGGARRTHEVRRDRQRCARSSAGPAHAPAAPGIRRGHGPTPRRAQGDDEFVLDRSAGMPPSAPRTRSAGHSEGTRRPGRPCQPVRCHRERGRWSRRVHHVALMRNVELVVKYLPGPVATTGRNGYSGVFRCAVDVDAAFRRAEPPTHDDWIYRAIPSGHDRTFVKVALDRIADVCREAAGYHASMGPPASGDAIPLGEFADALAVLMPGADGPGARRRATGGRAATGRKGTVRQPTLDERRPRSGSMEPPRTLRRRSAPRAAKPRTGRDLRRPGRDQPVLLRRCDREARRDPRSLRTEPR